MTDADLSRRCRQGEPDAWRLLVRRFSPLVYRIAVRMLRAGPEADDACQEVFMRVHKSFSSFDPTRPLSPWIARITYNVCLKQLGSSARRHYATDPADFTRVADDGAPDPELGARASESREIVTTALERLTVQDRVLIELSYRDGLSNSEVAEATGMPVGTVKTRLFRARKRLRKLLGPILKRGTT